MALPPENARKTHCEYGHPLSGDNLLVLSRRRGERVCRLCANRRGREHHRRNYVPHPRPPKPPREKKERVRRPAWQRVLDRITIVENGCWLWQGALHEGGYGVIQLGRGLGTTKTHRVTYEHFVGPIEPGMDVMHTCHTPACVNPAHLQVGTRAENMAMSIRDGRPLGPHFATWTK